MSIVVRTGVADSPERPVSMAKERQDESAMKMSVNNPAMIPMLPEDIASHVVARLRNHGIGWSFKGLAELKFFVLLTPNFVDMKVLIFCFISRFVSASSSVGIGHPYNDVGGHTFVWVVPCSVETISVNLA